MARKIDGQKIADQIISRVSRKIKEKNIRLKMAVFLVGNDPVSLLYVSQKEKALVKAGIEFSLYRFPINCPKQEIIKKIKKVSNDCSGLIVQLPLPCPRDEQEILDSIPAEKDIDLLSKKRLGEFYTGNFSVLPPVVKAFSRIINKEKISLQGMNIAVVGSGKLVGKPLTVWLTSKGSTVSVVNQFTKNKTFFIKNADLVVSGVGKKGLIKAEMIKKNTITIDAGSFFDGKSVKGDFTEKAYQKASLYTPVPGGIGPITTACLIENLMELNGYF
jgi:methylenetetrahydrofolate dehydrogenase (NADP+) / methenyltetrahydrofolate cyclohydrolase